MAKVEEIDIKVLGVLRKGFKERGNIDYYIKVKNIDLPFGIHQLGRCCARLSRGSSPVLKRVNKGKMISVYKTKFGEKHGKI